MQAKTPHGKTPQKALKRKSTGNASPKGQNGTPKLVKKAGDHPPTPFVKSSGPVLNKQKNPATPKAKPATPQVKKNENNEKKRKQSSGDEATSAKQQKLAKFPGTAALNKPTNGDEDKGSKKKARVAAKLKKRSQRRREIREAFNKLKEGLPLSPAFIESVAVCIKKLEAQPTLSKTAGTRLRTYRKLQAQINGEQPVNKKQKKQQKVVKGPIKQEKKSAFVPQQKFVKATEDIKEENNSEEDDEEEENSDVEEEENSDVEEEDDSVEDENESSGEGEDEDMEEDEDEESSEGEDETEEISPKPVKNQKQKASKPVKDTADKSNLTKNTTVYVGNFTYEVTKEDLIAHFSKSGKIKDVKIPVGPNNKSKGFAFIEFVNQDGYEKALALDQTTFKGRTIKVNAAQQRNVNGNQKNNKNVKKFNQKPQGAKNKRNVKQK